MDDRPSVIDEATATLDDVERALQRLSDGTYRTCETCGAELSEDVLAATPTRRACELHA